MGHYINHHIIIATIIVLYRDHDHCGGTNNDQPAPCITWSFTVPRPVAMPGPGPGDHRWGVPT